MYKKKILLLLTMLLSFGVMVTADAAGTNRNTGRQTVQRIREVTDPFADGYTGAVSRKMLQRMVEVNSAPDEKLDSEPVQKPVRRAKAAEKKPAAVKEKQETVKPAKPEKSVNPDKEDRTDRKLSPVQSAVRSNAGKFAVPAATTNYYLDGEKVEYPDKTRAVKYSGAATPVKVFLQGKRITDIYLNRDEHITDLVIDDPAGLRVQKTYEQGRYARWHVSVTPVDNTLGTDMYIATDKREYLLSLIPSGDGEGYHPFIRFAYPKNVIMPKQ